jgi:hypothetical protein
LLAFEIGLQLRLARGADIDDERLMSTTADEIGDKAVFGAFRIHGSEECDGRHRDFVVKGGECLVASPQGNLAPLAPLPRLTRCLRHWWSSSGSV